MDEITELRAAAQMAHELFSEYVRAGFDERQALYLTAKVITATQHGGED